MALIPPFCLDAVVALGRRDTDGSIVWIGTGFLMGRYHKERPSEPKSYHLFLVTNKHVLHGLTGIVVRFNAMSDEAGREYDVPLVEEGKPLWVGHPVDDADVAAISLDGRSLQNDGARFKFIKNDDHTFSVEAMTEAGVSEGDVVYILGFPMGLVPKDRQYAIVRLGCVARIRDVLENRSTDFLVDASVFPGNSGGPVILKPEKMSIRGTRAIKKSMLIGIVRAYVPYRDQAISPQTGEVRVVFQENSGLAVVTPADRILETVELAFQQIPHVEERSADREG